MKRPLVAVVSCYVAGLLIAGWVQPPLAVLFAVSFLVLALILIREKLRAWLIWPLLALLGWTNLTSRIVISSPDDLRILLGNHAAIVAVRGILAETPHIKIIERDGSPTERTLARVRVTGLRQEQNWRPADGEILVITPGTLPGIFFNRQPVEINGVMAQPPAPLAEGLFDYRSYLRTRGIYYQLQTGSTNDWQPGGVAMACPPLTDRFLAWSKDTLALGLPEEDEPLRLLWAMTLGWRTAFTGDISEPFLRAGTMHLFAIDGLRIALISGMLVALLRVLQVSRAGCGVVAIPAIWFYTAATGWESSAIRATVMMTIVIGGWALQRPSDLINSLAAAAFIILLWEPRQLFEASFQLSFFVVLIIALMLPPLNRLVDRWVRPDPLLPEDLLPRWRRALTTVLRMFLRYAALAVAAWLGSIPLSALYFHLFSPISPLANIVAVPLGTLALMSNLGSLVCGHWLPRATELFNHSAWFFMVAMTRTSEIFTKIPGAFYYVPAPSWLSIGLYYAVLVGALSGRLFAPARRFGSTAILILMAAVYVWRWERSRNEIELTVLPLNGGHAAFVDAAGRQNDWLVNCGDDDAAEFTLKPFLRARGVNTLPRLMLTGGDLQNIGGAESLDEHFGVGVLVTGPVKFRSGAYRKIVAGFEKPPGRHRVIQRGDRVGSWQILHPDAGENPARSDDAALVSLGTFHKTQVLLLSDLGREGQSALLAQTTNLCADIVVVGLPDAGEPLCDALLDGIRPKVIVVADSEYPATRRASRELKQRLSAQQVPVIYTRTAGAVKIVVDPDGWKLETMDGQRFASAGP